MIYPLIGLIVGLLMGITGAGGAIIAIPLFQLLLDATLKEATVLSLVTVLFGTSVNLFNRTGEVKWKVALNLSIAGTVANFLTLPLKKKLPDDILILFLITIGAFSIFSVWRSPVMKIEAKKDINILFVLIIGLFLGLVTTLTGLGGGVLLIPLLLYVFGLTYEEALPTSLASILLISLSALLIQGKKALGPITVTEILLIGAGAIASFTILSFWLRSYSQDQLLKVRKYVFSIATLISLATLILKRI
jgi:uncharacterized membrane protein YfcA